MTLDLVSGSWNIGHNDVVVLAETMQALDFALASNIATLRSRIPFVHAFDGFRTSHEIQKIQAGRARKMLSEDTYAYTYIHTDRQTDIHTYMAQDTSAQGRPLKPPWCGTLNSLRSYHPAT